MIRTVQSDAQPGSEPGRATMVRAYACGMAVATVLAGLCWLVGAVSPEFQGYLFLGLAGALVAGGIALLINGRFLDTGVGDGLAGEGALLAGRLQSLLAAAFAVKLAVLVLAVLVLRQFGVKFEATATFGITYAAASLICQLTMAGLLARSFGRRFTHRTLAGPATGPKPRNPS